MTIQTKDIYWLAGLLEGEGCFSVANKTRNDPVLILKMNDRDVCFRAQRILKPSKYRQNGNQPKRYQGGEQGRIGQTPFWVVRIAGRRAAGWMMTLYPLMGERRKARIHKLLTAWRTTGET